MYLDFYTVIAGALRQVVRRIGHFSLRHKHKVHFHVQLFIFLPSNGVAFDKGILRSGPVRNMHDTHLHMLMKLGFSCSLVSVSFPHSANSLKTPSLSLAHWSIISWLTFRFPLQSGCKARLILLSKALFDGGGSGLLFFAAAGFVWALLVASLQLPCDKGGGP